MSPTDTNSEFPRIEPRYRLNEGIDVRVLVQPHGSPEPVDAHLIDMSNSGMQLRLATCLTFDESMAVHILAGDLQFDLAATVKWIRQADEQSWSVGCHIKPELSEDALIRLASMGLLDRRESVRREVEMAASICGELESNRTPAVIRNLSEDGFGMATLAARVVGQRIRVAVPTPYGETIDITARVIWQIKTNRGFFCGCAFLNRESYAELIALADEIDDPTAPARRRRARSATRTSMWVALAALVVFVFPSLIVVMMDDSPTPATANGTAPSPADGSNAGEGEASAESTAATNDVPPRDKPSRAGSTHATAPSKRNKPSPSSEQPSSSADASTVTADAISPQPASEDLFASHEPFPASASGDPSPFHAAPPATTSASTRQIPPQVVAAIGNWLRDAASLVGDLDRAAREARANASTATIDNAAIDIAATNPPPTKDGDLNNSVGTMSQDPDFTAILDSLAGRPDEPVSPTTDDAPDSPAIPPSAPEPPDEPTDEPIAEPTEDLDGGFRTWVDITGRYRVSARIVAVEGNSVRLLKENGRYTTVPLDRLSKPDAAHARRWAASPRP